MNLLLIRVSLIAAAAASHKTFGRMMIRGFATAAGKLESEMPSRRGDCVTYYTLITDELSRAVELLDSMRRGGLSPSKMTTTTNYTSLINSLCKHDVDRIDEAYRVFIQMILSGFSPSVFTLNDVVSGFLRIGEMKGDYYNTLISEMCKAEELSHADELLDHMRRLKGLTPNQTTFTSLIDFLCKHDDTMINDAYMVFNEMFLSGFSPSSSTLNNVFIGLLRIGETEKAYEMFIKMKQHKFWMKMNSNRDLLLKRGFYHGNAYTNLMNAYLDEDNLLKVDQLRHHISFLPSSVINSVFINGLDNKARTTNTKMYLLRFNYDYSLFRIPTLQYRRTLAVNCSDDEFKSLVELVKGFCNTGLENAYDTMLKWNYKPDGIVYNLFIIEHCKCFNVHQAYNMYKEMVHYGFACHMLTLFPLIKTLSWEYMFNELRWVVQNVLRSCNLNDSEILQFLDEFNPEEPDSEPLFNVLAEKAKDGLFLKCSYAPPSA